MNHRVRLGAFQFFAESNFKLAGEVRGHTNEDKGFQGQPVTVAVGGNYGMSAKSTLHTMVELGANVHAQMRCEHKIDRHTRIAMHNSYEMGEKNPYKLGVSAEYTL